MRVIALFLSLFLLMPATALAESDSDDLSNVTFHTEYTDTRGGHVLREGVAVLWSVVKSHAAEQGLEEFPRAHIWGFDNLKDAARKSGIGINRWPGLDGYAFPGRAYILFKNNKIGDVKIVAHEATHLVQYTLSGSGLGSYCIAEGAAEWYSYKALDSLNLVPFEEKISVIKQADYEGSGFGDSEVSEESLRNSGLSEERIAEYFERLSKLRVPEFGKLTTRTQFQNNYSELGFRVYALCMLAFDMLIETGGGEEAYFNYLSELRTTSWRTAFNRAFTEDLSTFEARFARYRESGFQDYRFEDEIARDMARDMARDKFFEEFACKPFKPIWQEVCVMFQNRIFF